MAQDTLYTTPTVPLDALDQNTTAKVTANGNTHHQHYAADPEAQEMVVESLRAQIQDLFSQVTQLNSKLVKSYDRVSDLEDDLHVASAQLRTSSLKISQLELERTQHLAALNTGLLVEKHHVTAELNRLMEKATEEAAQRGQAESARAAIEKDLDDLSASLFNQANTMVAEARYARHVSEQKAEGAEQALKGAEEAVSAMQQRVQALQAEKESAEHKTAEMQALMGKGKWVERRDSQTTSPPLLLNSHLPYQEFLLFVAHIRHLHASSPNPPVMSTLLPLPFLTRISSEDSEPTVRLDLAPSLNWLSRRSVLAAIHNGQLIIEPISLTALLTESSHLPNAGISGLGYNNENIPCALCGIPIFPQASSTNTSPTRPPTHPLVGMTHSYSGSGSWSSSLFKKSANNVSTTTLNSQLPPLPPRSLSRTISASPTSPSQVYIFRISSSQTSAIPSIPLLKSSSISTVGPTSGTSTPTSSHQSSSALPHHTTNNTTPSQSSSTIYPLCTSAWCLARLRTTCSLWAFVRTGIVEKIWEEEIPIVLPPPISNRVPTSTASVTGASISTNGNGASPKPPIPPRKRGLWGIASAIGEKAASWSESVGDKDKTKKASTATAEERKIVQNFSPPPSHPQDHLNSTASTTTTLPVKSTTPPPLPKRSEVRARTPVNQPSTTPSPPVPAELVPPTSTSPPSPPPEQASATAPESLEHLPTLPVSDPPTKKEEHPSPNSPTPAIVSTPPVSPTRQHHLQTTSITAPPVPPRAVKRLSASVGRPGTPSSVPLPESRPNTPPVTSTTSRTGSPAIGVPSTVGGAPPIPRRAAARMPRKHVNEEGASDSRPGSPTVAPAGTESPGVPLLVNGEEMKTPRPQDGLKVIEENDQKQQVPTNTNALGDNALEVLKTAEVTHNKESQDESLSSEVEEFVDAEDGDGTPRERKRINGVELEKAKDGIEMGEEKKEETKEEKPRETLVQVDERPSISLNEEDLPLAAAPPPLPPRKSEELSRAKNVNEVEGEGEGQVYIGDATWEERVWKEVVKLKENMFSARIGAVRS